MKKALFILFLFVSASTFAQQSAEDFKDDWADLSHYEAENSHLPQPAAGEKRVVFLGSSIFEFWKQKVPQYFAEHKNYIDRGISGQISPQLLIRFQQDVVGVKAKAVIILAGSNDIAGTTGHVTTGRIMDNIRSMVQIAKANNIKVILCEYLPVYEYPWRKGFAAADKIIELNKAIKAYAGQERLVLLDYFSPLVDERNGQKAELTTDGVHPNEAGYKIMAKVTDEAIAKALK
ncbi:acylhydrolase [Mucilaginibacter sp. 21P]|uniref:GDSL-type esterase/lipase family protein n=1 Tax=Mucilaginibacter sp. 21P TaxID=2778902 RepID=UPI001C5737DD|nr:GDSL-type esterase/lipase family protein [Mucilaginibacter sp. 21P]QXV66005.1 acylhydrolase [Mucilaginibacter sp. 21P]